MTLLVGFATIWLFVIGVYGIATSRNVIHIVGCLSVAKSSTTVLLVSIGYRSDGKAPIREPDAATNAAVVDPVVQAILLVDVIVGATITALLLALAIQYQRRTGSLDPRALYTGR